MFCFLMMLLLLLRKWTQISPCFERLPHLGLASWVLESYMARRLGFSRLLFSPDLLLLGFSHELRQILSGAGSWVGSCLGRLILITWNAKIQIRNAAEVCRNIYIHIGELKSQFRSAHQSPVYLNWRIFVDLLLFLNLRWLRRGRRGIHGVRLEFGKDPLRRTRILRHSADTKPITANSGTYLPRDCCALLSTCHSNSVVWLGLALSTQKKWQKFWVQIL